MLSPIARNGHASKLGSGEGASFLHEPHNANKDKGVRIHDSSLSPDTDWHTRILPEVNGEPATKNSVALLENRMDRHGVLTPDLLCSDC